MDIERRLEAIEKRLAILEDGRGLSDDQPGTLEMDLSLPEADIGGLRFNKQKVHAVFDKKDDGWYHSRDILFMSARNVKDDNSRDILTKYVQWDVGLKPLTLRQQIAKYFGVAPIDIEVSLPKVNERVKRYNGVNCWYWIECKYHSSVSCFGYVDVNSSTDYSLASAVGGCAPAFRVVWSR